jgi:hypothetical protein
VECFCQVADGPLKSELQRFAREELEEEQEASVYNIMYEEEDTIQQIPSAGDQDKTETEMKRASRLDREEPEAKIQSLNVPRSALPTPREKRNQRPCVAV